MQKSFWQNLAEFFESQIGGYIAVIIAFIWILGITLLFGRIDGDGNWGIYTGLAVGIASIATLIMVTQFKR